MLNKEVTIYNEVIKYSLERAERKTVALCVLPCSSIVLKAPYNISEERLEKAIKRKYFWLKKQLEEVQKYSPNTRKKEYVSGESFLYLGRKYMIKVYEYQSFNKIQLTQGICHIYTKHPRENVKHIENIVKKWYEAKTQKIFYEELEKMLALFNYNFTPSMKIRKMNKRWGSCTKDKNIVLNQDLIKASKQCIDYVIAHELCHISHKKHDKNFYALLSTKFPHWRKIKEKLELRFV